GQRLGCRALEVQKYAGAPDALHLRHLVNADIRAPHLPRCRALDDQKDASVPDALHLRHLVNADE
ncbi:MAG: hypothetical protein WAO07_06820, partial [Desulfobacterales bacterium]